MVNTRWPSQGRSEAKFESAGGVRQKLAATPMINSRQVGLDKLELVDMQDTKNKQTGPETHAHPF